MNMAGVSDSVRFGSYTFDRILGLYYAQNRFYDPTLRSFTQPDPKWFGGISGGNSVFGDALVIMPNAGLLPDILAILQSTNLYAYCANNPVNFIDPRGLEIMHLEQDPGGSAASAASRDPVTRPPAPQPPINNTPPRDIPTATNGAGYHNTVAIVMEDVGFVAPTIIDRGHFNSAGCDIPSNFMSDWHTRAANFDRGVTDGVIDFFTGLPGAATAHVNNYLDNPLRASWEFKFSILTSPITKVQNLYNAFRGGSYELGHLYGTHLAQAGTMAATYGATKAVQTVSRAVTNPRPGSLTNAQARQWYVDQMNRIPDRVDTRLPLQQQAQQASNMRNQVRTQARAYMADRTAAAELNRTNPNLTWEQTVARYQAKGFSGDDLWREIINASQRSNPQVNQSFGITP